MAKAASSPTPTVAEINTSLDDYEAKYGVKFTDQEREMVAGDALGTISHITTRQRAHVFREALTPIHCPGCLEMISRRAGAPELGTDIFSGKQTPDDSYVCPFCGAKLTWHLGFIAGWEWFTLNRGQTITVPLKSRAEKAAE